MNVERTKTVGVVTMHRVINYGSFLQAYATQKAIEQLGYKCDIIDYIFPNDEHVDYTVIGKFGIKRFLSDLYHKLGTQPGHRKKNKIERAIKRYLNLSSTYCSSDELRQNPPVYDVYVTGSDQTWNPKHTKGDDTFLLAFAPTETKKISFSASIAGNNLNQEYKALFKEHLVQYDNISIRDSGGNLVMEELLDRSVDVTLDPTLMLNREEWSTFARNEVSVFPSNGYIVFYLITHSFDVTPYIYHLLKALQDKTGLKVFSFTGIPDEFGIDVEVCLDIAPENFIELFEKASYVVTSSFHGTAFAANFGVPIYSVVDRLDTTDDRQSSLLKKLGIEHCLVPLDKPFEEISPEYDVAAEQEKLEALREESRSYLANALL